MNPLNHKKPLAAQVLTTLFVMVLCGLSNLAYGNTDNYFARVTATAIGPTGAGTVYASCSGSNASNGTTGTTSIASGSTTTSGGNVSFTFTATVSNSGIYEFKGWSESNNVNGTIVSSATSYTRNYAASTTAATNNNNNYRNYNIYAVFAEKPLFYFSASAVVTPSGGGTASASPATLSVRGEHWNSTSATTTAIAFSAEPNAGYKFNGWSETADGAIVSTNNPYNPSLTSNSTSSGSPSNTTLYARFEQIPNPNAINTSVNSVFVCVGGDGSFSYSLVPSNAYDNVTVTSGNTSVATVVKNGHDITVHAVAQGSTTITLSATRIGDTSLTTTVDVTISVPCAAPTAISFNNTNNQVTITPASSTTVYYTTNGSDPTDASTLYSGPFVQTTPATVKAIAYRSGYCPSTIVSLNIEQVATPTITINTAGVSFDCATSGVTFYYTTNGDDPTAELTPWDGNPITGLAEGDTIKVLAAKSGMINSQIASKVFHISSGIEGGVVTLNDREEHTWSYYSDPNCPIRSLNPADVKITYYGDGIVMTGDADYTAGMAASNYVTPGQTNYTGGAKVNVGGEDENTFIYYKTLERGDATQTAWTFSSGNQSSAASRCPYTPIPNPFQVRPTYGSRGTTDANDFTGWRGFQCWRLKSVTGGAVYSAASGGTALTTGAVINAGTEIYFAPNSEYGMEVQLEAVWARAYLIKGNNGGANAILNYGNLGVERNFMTLTANENYRFNGTQGRRITNVDRAVTISCYYPSGEAPDNTNGVVVGNNNNITLGANTKFENVTLSAAAYTLTTSGYDVIIGRGCTSTNIGTVRGLSDNTSGAVEYTIRLESGTFGTFNMIDGTTYTHSGTVSAKTVFGCDYDRAKEDNSKLSIAANSTVYGASQYQQFSSNTNRNNLTYEWLIKSGTVQSSKSVADGAAANCIYMGNSGSGNDSDGNQYQGKRRLVMEGGEVCNISGGLNNYGNNYATYIVNDGWAVQICIKGGTVRGAIFGAAAFAGASGDRLFVFTGGTINGWVAGGANGTQNTGGELYGSTAMYMGGNTVIGSSTGGTHVGGTSTQYGTNGADGGHVFGAGCGILPNNGNFQNGTVGRVDNSTIVVADNAHIWRDVHGGGNYGWVRDNGTSDIYIAGGTIGGFEDYGSVFGGSNNQQGQEVSITVKGGDVKGGVYGGSHSWGTINDNVTMDISGGLVETGVFGGGYGTTSNSCDVAGTVDITMDGGTVLYGLYGGGNVNSKINGKTTVNINGGTIGASGTPAGVYGGGLGELTRAKDTVEVNIGSIDGSGNTSGDAVIYGDVYGGSAKGMTNCNDAGTAVANNAVTNVTLNSGTINGSLYGGGHGIEGATANVWGPVTVVVNGGKVNYTDGNPSSVFGCNNAAGSPKSTVTVTVNKTEATEIGQGGIKNYAINGVYGGGNLAHYNPSTPGNYPTVTVNGCTSSIKDVYGGGNAAAVPYTKVTIYGGDINRVFAGGNGESGIAHVGYMNNDPNPSGAGYGAGTAQAIIKGGTINQVFGGSNANGVIRESISVNVDKSTEVGACDMKIGEVYGGGNEAASQAGSITIGCTGDIVTGDNGHEAKPENIGTTLEGIGAVYGGANAALVTGNITLDITSGMIYRVFGGNNTSNTVNGTITVNINKGSSTCGWYVGYVYGGGNNAPYSRSGQADQNYPKVNIKAGKVSRDVFGAGKGSTAVVTGNPVVTLTGSSEVGGNVYGGGDQGAVNGETKVEIKD